MYKKKADTSNEYQVKPKQKEKFKATEARQIIRGIIKDKLDALPTNLQVLAPVSKEIADLVKSKLKDLNKNRYKYVVQVILGQQKGQGVQSGTRCFWDFETDTVAFEQYVNDHFYCLVTVYGVYLY